MQESEEKEEHDSLSSWLVEQKVGSDFFLK